MMGTWVAHIRGCKDHLGISKATLGLCLLCIAAGALVSMPLTGLVLDGRSNALSDARDHADLLPGIAATALATSPIMLAADDLVVFRSEQRGRWTSR